MVDPTFRPNSEKGEVAGAFLLGVVQSFLHLNLLPKNVLNLEPDDIDPAGWYPFPMLINVLDQIKMAYPSYQTAFFRAGVHFLRLWYEYGPGRAMIHSGRDWLFANQESGGYNSVVRGGSRDEIGWCVIKSIDEEIGIVVYENVTPLPADCVKGIFFGGCVLFDDMDYVEVDATSEPYELNASFNKLIITVKYRPKPISGDQDLDTRIENLELGSNLNLSPSEIERLVWRYKGQLIRARLDAAYSDDITAILADAINASQLAIRQKDEVLAQVKELKGLLPLCAWCKKIRNDEGYWSQIEEYVSHHSKASFTHGICPECKPKLRAAVPPESPSTP